MRGIIRQLAAVLLFAGQLCVVSAQDLAPHMPYEHVPRENAFNFNLVPGFHNRDVTVKLMVKMNEGQMAIMYESVLNADRGDVVAHTKFVPTSEMKAYLVRVSYVNEGGEQREYTEQLKVLPSNKAYTYFSIEVAPEVLKVQVAME